MLRLPVADAQATKSVVYIGTSAVSALYMVCTHSIVVVGQRSAFPAPAIDVVTSLDVEPIRKLLHALT
jgi:hypothetical protein